MRIVLFVLNVLLFLPVSAQAPYVDSKTIKEQFASITAKDMELLRSKKILLASRSFGLNLNNGFRHLAKENKMYEFLDSYERYDVFKAGGDVSVIPADAFTKSRYVHFLATYWPHTARLKETETLLRDAPHEFSKHTDIVIIYYHTAMENLFDTYAEKMDAMREAYPHITFIYVCAGLMAEKQAKSNAQTVKFNEKIRARYKGKVPLYDLGHILSDDGRAGDVYCPEYSKDPAGVHPNLPAGESMMAKGMLLILRDALKFKGGGTQLSKKKAKKVDTEPLKESHPEYQAVRALLDANGLTKKKVESVSMVENQHIVALYLQEGGVTKITKDIAKLRHLRILHLYGDRNLSHPLLNEISPSIGKCTRLEELLLNSNDLKTLPKEIAKLKKITNLSLADNKLQDLPSSAQRWAEKFDPEGIKQQSP